MNTTTRIVSVLALLGPLALSTACKPKPVVPEATADELLINPKKNFEIGVALLQTPDSKTGAIDHETAYIRFAKSAELEPNRHAHFNAGWVAEVLGRSADAINHYKAAYELDPSYEKAMFSLARVYNQSGQGDAAVALFQGYVAQNPDKLDIRNDLVVAFTAAERFDEAIAESQEILRREPKNAEVYRNLSAMYFKQGRYGMSQLTAEKALELNDGDAGTYNNLGVTYLIQEQQREAIAKFQMSRKLTNSKGYEPNMNLGWIAVKSGDYKLANECFQAAVDDRPASTEAKLGLAIALRGVKDYDRAGSLYDEIIKANPDLKAAYFNAATLHEKYTKNYSKALKYLDAFIDQNQGQVGPDHEVFARKDRVTESKVEEEKRKAEEEARKKAEIERQKRNEKLLKDLAEQVTAFETKLNANTSCLDPGVVEQGMMIIEQAKMVVEAGEADMAPDIKTFLDGEVATVDEAVAACAGGGSPAPEEAPAE